MAVTKVVGFDFVPGMARAVAVQGSAAKFTVTKAAEIPLPVHEESPEGFEPMEAAAAIRDWMHQESLRAYSAAISYQERKSILRLLTMPAMDEDELRSTIRFEFDQVMEESIDDYSIDSCVLDRGPGEDGERIKVLVAIVPKASVYPYVEAIEAARMTIVRANLPVLANLSAVSLTRPETFESNCVLVHLEIIGGDVLIFDEGQLAFVRRVSLGAHELKYAFAGLVEAKPPEEVDSIGGYKLDDYRIPDAFVEMSRPLVDMVNAEVERTISFYKSQRQSPEYAYDSIVICGNGVWPRNLPDMVERTIPQKVIYADPLGWCRERSDFALDAQEDLSLPQFGTPLGLALDCLS
ncbi:MAG: hypothetical protein B1H03_03325 [Planctomycetales bacterium 4484_113]|nr:MAG: hypothetical protein B1H03_03325 [Planctomycetales bacterium 4484_113]